MNEKDLFYLVVKKAEDLRFRDVNSVNRGKLILTKLENLVSNYNQDYSVITNSIEFLNICNILC